MQPTRDRFCGVTRRLLTFAGQWPYQGGRERLLTTSVTITSVCSIQIPQICKLVHCGGDLLCLLGPIPSFLLMVIVWVKLFTCQFNRNKIKDLTERLIGNWLTLKTTEEYEIMRTYAANGSRVVLLYASCCIGSVVLFMSTSLVPRVLDAVSPVNESRPVLLPYEAYYFVDEGEYFYYIFLYSLVTAPICVSVIVAHDCMLLTYVQHACGVFAVAGHRSEHLTRERDDVVEAVNDNNPDDTFQRKVAFCVQAHWVALEFVQLIENTFSQSFIVQLMIITMGMSITLVQITMRSDVLEVTRYVMYVIVQLVHLFMFSWQGQKVIDHSLRIRDKIYNCRWYKIASARSQRLLLNVMRRSLQPNVLTAGRLYIFSLQSFTTVVQSSVSYFTVLASFQ